MERADLMDHLENHSLVFKDARVKKAFGEIDRADFVGEDYKVEAYEDYAVPIGNGQDILQPTRTAFILELLEVREGNSVLDIGSGSGWTAALLASMVGPEGKVFGTEIVPELLKTANENLRKYSFTNLKMEPAGERLGLSARGPFDRILVTASAEDFPDELTAQLKEGGVIVVPVGESIWRVKKGEGGKLEKREYEGFRFTPLIT